MKLQHITFTGIDAKTDIKALTEIQREFPIAEFGVLEICQLIIDRYDK